MRKKDLLAGQYNVYAVFDKVSKHHQALYYATTDEEFIRKYLPKCIASFPLRDLSVFKIGTFNDVTGELKQTIRKRVDVECYCFPHSRLSSVGDNVKLSDLEESIQKTKNEILSLLTEEENNNKGAVNE